MAGDDDGAGATGTAAFEGELLCVLVAAAETLVVGLPDFAREGDPDFVPLAVPETAAAAVALDDGVTAGKGEEAAACAASSSSSSSSYSSSSEATEAPALGSTGTLDAEAAASALDLLGVEDGEAGTAFAEGAMLAAGPDATASESGLLRFLRFVVGEATGLAAAATSSSLRAARFRMPLAAVVLWETSVSTPRRLAADTDATSAAKAIVRNECTGILFDKNFDGEHFLNNEADGYAAQTRIITAS